MHAADYTVPDYTMLMTGTEFPKSAAQGGHAHSCIMSQQPKMSPDVFPCRHAALERAHSPKVGCMTVYTSM